jgi:hypothetical protein
MTLAAPFIPEGFGMMSPKRRLPQIAVITVLTLLVVWRLTAGGPRLDEKRASFDKAVAAGNFKDAYEGLRHLALDPKADPLMVGKDLTQAIFSLEKLGRADEIDAFREAVVVVHKGNWRLMATAARTCMEGEHHGRIVAGEFHRGFARDQGHVVSAGQRDRIRALQPTGGPWHSTAVKRGIGGECSETGQLDHGQSLTRHTATRGSLLRSRRKLILADGGLHGKPYLTR